MGKANTSTSPSIQRLTRTEMAWLAGFIDGEGFIGITRQNKRESAKEAAGIHYHAYLIITGTDRAAIHYIHTMTGCGHVAIQNRTGGNKTSYQWKLSRYADLLEILKQVRPYLRIKRSQCDLVVQFITLRNNVAVPSGRGSRGQTSYTEAEHHIYQQLKVLNKKGI